MGRSSRWASAGSMPDMVLAVACTLGRCEQARLVLCEGSLLASNSASIRSLQHELLDLRCKWRLHFKRDKSVASSSFQTHYLSELLAALQVLQAEGPVHTGCTLGVPG